jgi:hypothetical protein
MSLEDQLNNSLKILGVYISQIEGILCLNLPGSLAVSAISKRHPVNSRRGGRIELLTQQLVCFLCFVYCVSAIVCYANVSRLAIGSCSLGLHRKQKGILSEYYLSTMN